MLVGLVLGFMVYLPQATLAKLLPLTFSRVEQCGPVSVNFSDLIAQEVFPLTLNVFPFDSVPISIELQFNPNSLSGATIPPLPLPADTTFIASLDDSSGNSATNVSDINRVLASSNSSCLPSTPVNNPQQFKVNGTFEQCQTFNITFDPNIIKKPPFVRQFTPRGTSSPVDLISQSTGMATYILDVPRGMEVVLLMDDGNGLRETSPLMTVDGDTSSSTNCLSNILNSAGSTSQGLSSKHVISQAASVGIAVATSIVVFMLATLAVFYVRRERRRRYKRSMPLNEDEKLVDLPQFPPPKSPMMDYTDKLSMKNEDTPPPPVTAKVIPRSRRQGLLPSRRTSFVIPRSWLDMGNRESHTPSRIREAEIRESMRSIDIDRVLDEGMIFDDAKSFGTASFKSEVSFGDQTTITASFHRTRDPPDVPACVAAPVQSQRGYRTFRRYLRPPSLKSIRNPNAITRSNSGAVQAHHSIGAITLPVFNDYVTDRSSMSEAAVLKPDSPTRGRRSFASIAATLASSIEVPPPVVVRHNGGPIAY